MLNPQWTPTPLFDPQQKTAVTIRSGSSSGFRSLRVTFRLAGFFAFLLVLRLSGRYSHERAGQAFARFCRDSGLLWIKLGQFLSTRVDILPQSFCHPLIWLQDRIDGFPTAEVRRVIEEDLGHPLEEMFTEFSPEPVAAASIAQVHQARLKGNGQWVAIKVRRPGIDRIFASDIRLVRFLLQIPQRFSIMPQVRWKDMLWEMEKAIEEELDYRFEISNLLRLRKLLVRHGLYAPKLYRRYCGRNVVVMEYIQGVTVADFLRLEATDPQRVNQWMKANGIQRSRIGKRLFWGFLRQVLEENLFHADLHPGNIVLLRGNRIALLDFGSLGSLEADTLRKYSAYLEALSDGQYAKAIDLFLLMMLDVPAANLNAMKEELLRELRSWGTRTQIAEIPYKFKSIGFIANEFTRLSAKYGVTIPWSFFRLIRGFTTMDVSLNSLIARADLPVLMQRYTRDRQRRTLRATLNELPMDLLRLQNLIDYPIESRNMAIYRGAAVRRLAQVFEGATDRVSRLVAHLFMILATLATAVWVWALLVYLNQHQGLSLSWLPFSERFSLEWQPWLLIFVISSYAAFGLWRLTWRFLEAE